jgi:hypothetical protein
VHSPEVRFGNTLGLGCPSLGRMHSYRNLPYNKTPLLPFVSSTSLFNACFFIDKVNNNKILPLLFLTYHAT